MPDLLRAMSQASNSSDFVRRLNAATNSSFEELDRRYRQRLCNLVEKQLNRRFAGREDPEDAVQSALRSLFRGLRAKRFHIDHSGALWKLLAQIVGRKVLKHVEHHQASKRRPGLEVPVKDTVLVSREPTPDEAAHVADVIAQLVARLDPTEVEIFRLRLQGFTKAEIATELDCTQAIVRYRLDKITEQLARILADKGDI